MNNGTTTSEMEAMNYLEDYAGAGLDAITQNEQAVGYLNLVQPGSQAAADGDEPGTWRNSATGENYGPAVRVIVLAFRTIWNERDNDTFRTVARYAPHSINVDIQQPKAGKKGYPKMINPDSGNEIQELYVYAVALPDHPEAGILYFNPTVGSMRACRSWNTQLKSQLLPNGMQAPIFGFSWHLLAELVQNPVKPAEKVARFTKVQRDSMTSKDVFMQQVKPQLEIVTKEVLAITQNLEADNADGE